MQEYLLWQGSGWNLRVLYSRAGVATSILVSLESGERVLLDCGDGSLRDLVALEVNLDKLSAILLSHAHFDHVGGIYSLLGFMRMIGRGESLKIFTPNDSVADGLILESFHKAYPDTIPYDIERHEIRDGEEVTIGELTVEAFRVIHCGSTEKGGIGDPLPAVGYSMSFASERVVYTGDCGLDSNLEARLKGADLAVVEATLAEPGGEMERRVHLSLESAERLSRLAKRAFIIHTSKRSRNLDLS